MELQKLYEERAKVFDAMRQLRDKSDWTAEDHAKWKELNESFDSYSDQIEAAEANNQRSVRFEEIAELMERQASSTRSEVGQARQERAVREGREVATEEQRTLALQGFLLRANGLALRSEHEHALAVCGINNDKALDVNLFRSAPGHGAWSTGNGNARLGSQYRALSVGTAASGGYTVPEGFMAELEQTMLDFGGLRRVARIISTPTGNDMPWPTANDTGNTGELLAEAGSIGSSVDPTFGVVTLKAYKYSSKPVIVSAELLEDSAFNLASVLAQMLGERIGRITSTHFATGDNSAKPQGVTVGASAGVTAASATVIAADELFTLQDSLDPAYEGNSTGWAFNKTTISELRKLKDTTNQYLWQPGLQAGVPDLLLGRPVVQVQDMPNTATGLVAGVYGDFSKYIIRDAASVRFYRLEELYRANDQTGFVLFSRHDGRVLQSAALKKITML